MKPDTALPPLAERHLLSLRTLSQAEWQALLAASEQLSGAEGRRPLLAGLRLGLLLFNPSLRTRTAFEVACLDLGAHALPLTPGNGTWAFEHRDGVVMDGAAAEHIREAIGVLGRLLDGLGVRSFAGLRDAAEDAREELLGAVVAASRVPVLNLESASDHPLQGLADALVLRRRFPGRRLRVVISWAPHIKPLPRAVPQAALVAFAREGHEVVLAHPPGFELDAEVTAQAAALATAAGGSLSVSHERESALGLRGAAAEPRPDIVYLKSWGAAGHYGDAPASAAAFAQHAHWKLSAQDLGAARFMHCLPVRRGVVVDDAVLDGDRSLVLDQAEARLAVQKAALCRAFAAGPFAPGAPRHDPAGGRERLRSECSP